MRSGSAGSHAALRIHLLGAFAVERDGERLPEEAWSRRRARDLLQLLAMAPGHRLPGDTIVETLWPDKDASSGANNLHRALYDLRKVIGSDFVKAERGSVRLRDDVWIDLAEFERLSSDTDPARLGEALSIFRGDLVASDDLPDVENRREQLRRKFVDATLRLAQDDARRDRRDAIDRLRRLLDIDPANESAHQLLIRCLAEGGRRAEALRQYEICVENLRRELDAEPAQQTFQLYEAVVRGDLGPPRPQSSGWQRVARRLLGSTTPPALRGRSELLTMLDDFVAHDSGVLLLMGEAGIGKTHAAVEGARLAHGAGAVLMCGAALEFVQPAPYAPFVDAWSDFLRCQGRDPQDNPFVQFQASARGNPQEEKLRLFEHVQQSLESLAAGKSIYLVIDDLHFADESTLLLFHYLGRAARTMPLLLVGTCREEELAANPALHSLVSAVYRERLGRRVPLSRLDRQTTRQLVGDLVGETVTPEELEAIYESTGGNPFFIEEVVESLRERGPDASLIPADLATLIVERVQRLGKRVEDLLTAGAAVGHTFEFEIAQSVAGSSDALDALELAIAAKLVEEDDRCCRFRHGLVREALYQRISASRRKELHRMIADVVEARYPERVEALSFHLRSAGELRRALPYLIEAARRASSRLGLGEAGQLYRQALDAMDELQLPPDEQRLEVLLRLGQMNYSLSNLDDAVQHYDSAAALLRTSDGWRPSEGKRAKARRGAALALITAGRLDEADSRLQAAMSELAAGEGMNRELPNVLYHLAQLRWHEGRHDEAYAVAEQCLREAERQDDTAAIAKAYEMLSLSCHSLGQWSSGVEFEERRRTLVGSTVDVAQAFDVHL